MAAKVLGASGVIYTDQRQFYLEPFVTAELWPTVAPFTTVVSQKPIKTGLADPVFKQFEHRSAFINQKFQVNGSMSNIPNDDTGVDIDIDNITGLSATPDSSWVGLTVECWDVNGTVMKGRGIIKSVTDSDTVKITSIDAAAFSPAVADNDWLYVIGNAQGEESEAPDGWADDLRVVFGNTQMMETAVHISTTLAKAALRGYSSELARLREEKNKEFKMQMERTFLFGGNVNGANLDPDSADSFGDLGRTIGSKKVRTTLGIVAAIEKYGKTTGDRKNIFNIVKAGYDWNQYVEDTEKIFGYYPEDGVKYAFCGPGAMTYWSQVGAVGIAENSGWKVNLSPLQMTKLGFAVKMLETPHGVLALVPTPAFRGPRNNQMLIISDSNLQRCQFQAPQFLTNIKTENHYKGVKDVYFADEGLGMTLIESHYLIKIT